MREYRNRPKVGCAIHDDEGRWTHECLRSMFVSLASSRAECPDCGITQDAVREFLAKREHSEAE